MPDQTPPITGIARKTRSDKGQPRKSKTATLADQFMDMPAAERCTTLTLLAELHRQAERGKIQSIEVSKSQKEGE